jgi:acyl carrier protein phosphodiesterase
VVRLPDFISEIYRDIETCSSVIPAEANPPLQRMREEDWLGRYHHTAGVADILGRIRRPFDLAGSLPIFQQHESAFLEDFQAFFPELKTHLQVQPAE